MKRNLFILIILAILKSPVPGLAQNPVPAIETLDIEIWPDYDRASVLVLLTGTLSDNTRFPASITLPLPENARLNAVARIDQQDGAMKDDIFSVPDTSGSIKFITPDPGFRVEYYLPYSINNNQRSFDFTWQAAIPVQNFQLRVQRPTSARTLNTEPAAANVARSGDGFTYHTFPARAVPAGIPFSLHVNYIMTSDHLSATGLPSANTNIQNPISPATPKSGSGINWALIAIIAGGILIFAALIWQLVSRHSASNMPMPADKGAEKKPSQAKFCRNCGEAVDEGDRFCSGCGTEL
jgi:hypothetical protein